MISKASVKYVHISPRKVRYVLDLVRKKSVPQAQAIFSGLSRRAGEIVRKLMNQAIDAAEKNSHVHAKDLYISKIMADGGPMMRRFRAASMGRASVIHKRTCHIYMELDQIKKTKSLLEAGNQKKKAAAEKAPPLETPKKKLISKKTTVKKLAGAK